MRSLISPAQGAGQAEDFLRQLAAWARTVACCPACQVTPGVECHDQGRPLYDGAVHPQRTTEAEETAA